MQRKALGVTKDGVRILKPKGRSAFSTKAVARAIGRIVRARKLAEGDSNA